MIGSVGFIRKTLGWLSDHVAIPFVSGVNSVMAYLVTGYYHIHGEAFLYPDLAAPVTLTSGAGVWGIGGAITEIIPANALPKAFDLHWIAISEISANLSGVIHIYAGAVGAEVVIGKVECFRNNVNSFEGNKPVQIPQQPANTRISAKFHDDTALARTCTVKLYGHFYG